MVQKYLLQVLVMKSWQDKTAAIFIRKYYWVWFLWGQCPAAAAQGRTQLKEYTSHLRAYKFPVQSVPLKTQPEWCCQGEPVVQSCRGPADQGCLLSVMEMWYFTSPLKLSSWLLKHRLVLPFGINSAGLQCVRPGWLLMDEQRQKRCRTLKGKS